MKIEIQATYPDLTKRKVGEIDVPTPRLEGWIPLFGSLGSGPFIGKVEVYPTKEACNEAYKNVTSMYVGPVYISAEKAP